MQRGEVWWAELGEPSGSEPGYRRPVLIIQSNAFNRSRIATVIAAVITSNIDLAQAPGNVALTPKQSHLNQKSVVTVSQIVTLDKRHLMERVGRLTPMLVRRVEDGLRVVLGMV